MNITWEMDIEDLNVAVVFALETEKSPAHIGDAINPPMAEWFGVTKVEVNEVQGPDHTWHGSQVGNVLQDVLVRRFWHAYAQGEDELINEFAKIKHDAAVESSHEAFVIY